MRTTKVFLIPYILLIFLSTLLSAAPTAESVDPTSQKPGSEIRLTDSAGRTLSFDSPPQRILIGGRAVFMLADAMYLFPEARDRVVAVGETSQGPGDFFPVIEPDAATIPRIGRTAGVEEIAAHNPDLVVLKSFMQESLGNQLDQVGIPVLYLDLETPDSFLRDLRIIGALFDNTDRADQLVRMYDERLGAIASAVEGRARPSVVLLSYTATGEGYSFGVAPEAWIQTDQVRLGGGLPAWFDGAVSPRWNQVQFEQLALWDPDAIIMVSYRTSALEAVDAVSDDGLWGGLQSVQSGRLLAMPNDFYSWAQPDTRWILGTEWVARALHPGALEGSMEESVFAFFRDFYGIDRATFDGEILPTLEGELF